MTSRREGEQRLSPGRSSAQQSAPGGKFFLLVCSCRARVDRPFAGMSSSSCGALCALHLLKFAEIDGFEDDTPDVSDLLAEFKGALLFSTRSCMRASACISLTCFESESTKMLKPDGR